MCQNQLSSTEERSEQRDQGNIIIVIIEVRNTVQSHIYVKLAYILFVVPLLNMLSYIYSNV